ncbi:unnamed protein product, partial [marine sediment metagenome]
IGNITVGGTGKTPTVIMLANLLKERGYRPAVLSRGYGGKKRSSISIISDGSNILAKPDEAGDEPALIAKSVNHVPVITGPNRFITGKYAIDHLGADVLILDDAFQHRSLFRDIDIVLLDGKRPFGNGFPLPRGSLREPKKALKRADIIVLTGTDREEEKSLIANKLTPPPCPPPSRGRVWEGVKKGISYTIKLPPVPIFRGYHKPKDLVKGSGDDIYPR